MDDNESALEGGKPPAQIARDLGGRQPPFQAHLRFFEYRKQRGRIAGLGPRRSGQSGERRHAHDAGRVECDPFDFADDLGGSRQRGRARQLHGHDDIAAILAGINPCGVVTSNQPALPINAK